MRTLFLACFLFGLFVPATAVAQSWKPAFRAVASAYCGADEGGGRLFVPYIEHDIRAIYAYSTFQSADCKAAMGAVCGLLHPGELTLWRDLKCGGWPLGKGWVEQPSPAPLTEREWENLPGPFAIEDLKEDLIFLQELVVKYAKPLVVLAVLAIVAAAVVAAPESFGTSLVGAAISIAAILTVYYDQFTPAEKQRFDEIRAMTASIEPREVDVEIDEIRRRIVIDDTEITMAPGEERPEVRDLAPGEPGLLDFMAGDEPGRT